MIYLGNMPVGVALRTTDEQSILHTTLQSEMHLKDILTNYPIPLKYKYEMCFVKFDSNDAPSQGTAVNNWRAYIVQNGVKQGALYSYKKQPLVAPNELSISGTVSSHNQTYYELSNNSITASNTTPTNIYFAPGTKIYVLHVPWRFDTLCCDEELIS